MRDLDQRLGPFADRLAMQEGHSILGHDIADQAARSDDSRTRIEHGNDPRNGSVFRGRGKGNNRLAAFRTSRTAQEINLPADTAVELLTNGVRTHLTGGINLQGGIY